MVNPFFYGNPVSPDQFLDRRRELSRIAGRIVNQGQSAAIVGEPRTGKTSLLDYLAAPEARTVFYGEEAKLLFSYLDAQGLEGEFGQAQFWEYALRPLHERVIVPEPNSSLAQAYQTCQDNGFGTFELERLFAQMGIEDWRLVLLLDEFDDLLYHPILNCAEFFGSLRGLASRSRGSLALIIASRHSLAHLNYATQQFSRTGSPYFNIFAEITLEPFPERDIAALLDRAGDRFPPEDRRAIHAVVGGHPFLLQVAAAAMWDAWEEGLQDSAERRRYLGQRLYREHKLHFADTWQVWSPATRKAFTSVALAHTAHLLPGREFLTAAFIEDMHNWRPELNDLEATGLLARDEQVAGGWRVAPQSMLWWLADELVRAVRPDVPFETWLCAQEFDGLLTRKEQEQLGEVTRGAVQVLRQGATTLVEAFAKGLGTGLAGGA